jgi:glutamate racemase
MPIGVFDSGLGGLTVAHAIRQALPGEHMVYLGDTARVPYGTRSAETVVRYARSCAKHLANHRVKLLVVACNTVSAVALDMLRVELDVPVLGVIGPGARAGVAATHNGRMGVIATAGTVGSGAYVRAATAVDSRVEVFAHAAPLLVPLAEEGWLEGEVPRLAARRYLEPLASKGMGSLVLGCTHYPLLGDIIRAQVLDLCGPEVTVVDSARATAEELSALLTERGMHSGASEGGSLRLLVTDLPGRFVEVASRFLGEDVEGLDVTAIDL